MLQKLIIRTARILTPMLAVLVLSLFFACSGTSDRITAGNPGDPLGITNMTDEQDRSVPVAAPGHVLISSTLTIDLLSNNIESTPCRNITTHLDLQYMWKDYPDMLTFKLTGHDPINHILDVEVTFKNPLDSILGDVRAIWPPGDVLAPVTFDGWSIRGGAPEYDPDPFFTFGIELPNRLIAPDVTSSREISFEYDPDVPLLETEFVLDATVDANTAEPFDFSDPDLYGRFFSINISDWQDDITSVVLDMVPADYPYPVRLQSFGEGNRWGGTVPDIKSGDYWLRLIALSPETPGEINDDLPATAIHWISLSWPPDDPLVPLPHGQGIYGYSFIDPDTNLPPTNAVAFMNKFRGDMGGDFIILEYGEICNSGYLAMHESTPQYFYWMNNVAPDLPIHLNFDNLGFPPADQDPCGHAPLGYTELFFEHLLASIRGQVLENPDFDCVSGIHFDIEPNVWLYTEEELFEIYDLYADFLAKLHLEPDLNGRNITVYDNEVHPEGNITDLYYLSMADAFMPEVYYSRYHFSWDPETLPSPFYRLNKQLGLYHEWATRHGTPYYPVIATFSCWIDAYMDDFPQLTLCPGGKILMIDEYCFGKGPLNTCDEYVILDAHDVHGKVVESVLFNLESGEPIFPATGFAVYMLGDGNPDTIADDSIFIRTAYATAKTLFTLNLHQNPLMPGFTTFRYENDQVWKAAGLSGHAARGEITCIGGYVSFSDDSTMQDHPELWGNITIELIDPDTVAIHSNPAYMTSTDIIGAGDGSYLLPDLPTGVLTLRAHADGWQSDPVTVEMTQHFAYRDDVNFVLNPL